MLRRTGKQWNMAFTIKVEDADILKRVWYLYHPYLKLDMQVHNFYPKDCSVYLYTTPKRKRQHLYELAMLAKTLNIVQ